MTGAELNTAFAACGAAAWGYVSFATLAGQMDFISRAKAEELVPNPAAVLVAAFPYFTGQTKGNLSLYARGADYHAILRQRLNTICDYLLAQYPEYLFFASADNSPIPERQAAWLAGLGLRGRNGLFILPPYGSYVFLGTILTDAPLDTPKTTPAPDCIHCGKCVTACPSGALNVEHMFHVKQCLSDLTQKKGVLTADEAAQLKAHPYIWGCDICQNVCPYNRTPKIAPLPEFEEGYLADLTGEMLAGMTNRTFAQTFGRRAFAWRGLGVLRRNLDLKNE